MNDSDCPCESCIVELEPENEVALEVFFLSTPSVIVHRRGPKEKPLLNVNSEVVSTVLTFYQNCLGLTGEETLDIFRIVITTWNHFLMESNK